MSLLLILIIIVFLAGIYFVAMYGDPKSLEGLTTMTGEIRCPNMLIQKGSRFYLYNSNLAQVPGVNPVEFENLEDYVEFISWQHSQGIRCPVLYLQQTYDAQGQSVYKARPSVTEPQGGLPPALSTNYPGAQTSGSGPGSTDFNPNYAGSPTINQPTSDGDLSNAAVLHGNEASENMLFSPNAMDDTWGGKRYTQQLVDAGYYEGNEVNLYVP
jgi:hypothetical protein